MTRLTYFIVLFLSISFIWLAPLYYPISATMFEEFPKLHLFWRLIPIELLFIFGFYSVFSVLNAVRKVEDFPKSKQQLLDDIKDAKEQLSKAGFDWN